MNPSNGYPQQNGMPNASHPYSSNGAAQSHASPYGRAESYGQTPYGQNTNPNAGSFPKRYGSQSAPPKKKGSKKALTITISVLVCTALIIAGVLCAIFLPGYLYERRLNDAQTALNEGHYEKALKTAKSAQSSRPEELKPYAIAYEAALGMESKEDQDEILSKAKSSLGASDLHNFEYWSEILEEDYAPNDPYVVICDLGELDIAPIQLPINGYPYSNRGWVIRQNGEYKYLDTDGRIHETAGVMADRAAFHFATDSSSAQLYEADSKNAVFVPLTDQKGLTAYTLEKKPDIDQQSLYTLDTNEDLRMVMDSHPQYAGSDSPSYPIMATKEDVEKARKRANQPVDSDLFYATSIDNAALAMLDGQDYYIYDPNNDETFGPFKADEDACFNHWMLRDKTIYFDLVAEYPNMQWAGYVFRTKETEENIFGEKSDVYTLHASTQSESKETGFDDVVLSSPFTIGGIRNGRLYMYNSAMECMYDGRFEDGACIINGTVPVKMNGSWELIHFIESDEEYLTDTITDLETIKAIMKEDPKRGFYTITSTAEDLLNDLDPSYASIAVPKIYVDGVRYIPDTSPIEPESGSLLIFDPSTWTITYSAESSHGNPAGETIQIQQFPDLDDAQKIITVTSGQCDQNGSYDSVVRIQTSKDSYGNMRPSMIYSGSSSSNCLHGPCTETQITLVSGFTWDTTYENGKVKALRKMTDQEADIAGYSGYVIAEDDNMFYSIREKSIDDVHTLFDKSVFGYAPVQSGSSS